MTRQEPVYWPRTVPVAGSAIATPYGPLTVTEALLVAARADRAAMLRQSVRFGSNVGTDAAMRLIGVQINDLRKQAAIEAMTRRTTSLNPS